MTRGWPGSTRVSLLVVIGLVFVALPVVLTVASGAPASVIDIDTEAGSGQTAAAAADGETLVVDDDTAVIGATPECPNANYTVIQDAVDDAGAGDTVEVCTGTYTESVTVETSDLDVRTNGTAQVYAGPQEGFNITSSGVTVDGFTVTTSDGVGIRVTGDQAVVENNEVQSLKLQGATPEDDGIRLESTNETVVRNNTVVGFPDHGLSVGEGDDPETRVDESTDNLVVDNRVTGLTDTEFVNAGIYVGTRAAETVVRNNTVTDIRGEPSSQEVELADELVRPKDGVGIKVHGSQTEVRGNTLERTFWGVTAHGPELEFVENTMRETTFQAVQLTVQDHHVTATNNTIDGSLSGGIQAIVDNGTVELSENTVENVDCGVELADTGCGSGIHVFLQQVNGTAQVDDNRVTNNTIGIRIDHDETEFEGHDRLENVAIHGNVIVNNDAMGIDNANEETDDDHWPVVDATGNFWGCDGPSGALQDPDTGTWANGTGDPVSAGDVPQVSNVHFDPFFVHNPARCAGSQPTPTPTPTATPSDSTDSSGSTRSGYSGGGGAYGTGEDDAEEETDADGDDDTDDETGTGSEETPTATPTATATETPTPDTATPSPTPDDQPGFGVLTWLAGAITVLGILAVRRRRAAGGSTNRD